MGLRWWWDPYPSDHITLDWRTSSSYRIHWYSVPQTHNRQQINLKCFSDVYLTDTESQWTIVHQPQFTQMETAELPFKWIEMSFTLFTLQILNVRSNRRPHTDWSLREKEFRLFYSFFSLIIHLTMGIQEENKLTLSLSETQHWRWRRRQRCPTHYNTQLFRRFQSNQKAVGPNSLRSNAVQNPTATQYNSTRTFIDQPNRLTVYV